MKNDIKKMKELMEEMLSLAGVPLNEADEEEDQDPDLDSDQNSFDPEEMINAKPEEKPAKKDNGTQEKEKKEDEEELSDEWTANIASGGELKIKLHSTYLYVTYKGRKSEMIKIPEKLVPMAKPISKLFNTIMNHVEKVS